jgi:hypothetical protein
LGDFGGRRQIRTSAAIGWSEVISSRRADDRTDDCANGADEVALSGGRFKKVRFWMIAGANRSEPDLPNQAKADFFLKEWCLRVPSRICPNLPPKT